MNKSLCIKESRNEIDSICAATVEKGAIPVDSRGVGARVPPEFWSSEKSTPGFVKLSTVLGGTCNLKTGVNLVSLYFLCDKQRVDFESEGVLLHPFL